MHAHKIPVTIVTGFLGAGKTTLIRELLQRAGERRIALIINEFGECGFDAALTRSSLAAGAGAQCMPRDIVELTNGCICCTVAEDFLPTMTALLDGVPAPDHIIVETSGLALPQPLVDAFNWPDVRSRASVDSVVTLIDAPARASGRYAADEHALAALRAQDDALDHETPIEELYHDQLVCADLVVVNKTDLVSEDALAALQAEIAGAARPGVEIVAATHGAVSPDVLIGRHAGAEADLALRRGHHGAGDHHDHDHDDFACVAIALAPCASLKTLENAVAEAAALPGILRIKGAAPVAGKAAFAMVQAVGPRVQCWFSPPFEDPPQIVIIALQGSDIGRAKACLMAASGALPLAAPSAASARGA